MYFNIKKKYLTQLAKEAEVKFWGKSEEEIIEDLLEEDGYEAKLDYLDDQFMFGSVNLTLCQMEDNFPDKSNTPEKFIQSLVDEKVISRNQVNKEWEPTYNKSLQICAVRHEGSAVYIKVVEERINKRRNGYRSVASSYAHTTSMVLHFGEQNLIQLRCPHRESKKYAEYITTLMGFAQPAKWFAVPKLTVPAAKKLCELLSAGVEADHIALAGNVGSVRFHAVKGIDLHKDPSFAALKEKIEELGLDTSQSMDQHGSFEYKDPVTSIKVEAKFEVNIQGGFFKFTAEVPEFVIDHVLDSLMLVNSELETELLSKTDSVDEKELTDEQTSKFPISDEVLALQTLEQ